MIGTLFDGAARAIARVTRVPHDVERRDRCALDVAAASTVGRAIVAARDAVERAWRHSMAGRLAARSSIARMRLTRAERLQCGAVMVFTAALVGLLLRPFAGRPEPLTWIVPVVAAIASAIVALLARPLANALVDRCP